MTRRKILEVVAAALALGGLLLAVPCAAVTRRVAVVVGNSVGRADEQILRFAESDAEKLSRVMVDLGGVEPADMFLLRSRRPADIEAAVASAASRAAEWHADPSVRVLFFFYFSGHSDGEALHVGGETISYARVRALAASTRADVRVLVLDSCQSGAVVRSKGGRRGAPFDIRLADDLTGTGEVVITSSAANEVALESTEIGGAFFTHHLVSGLRGAADRSGDDRVSLSEAYDYAFDRTMAATGNTIAGTQHPSYDYRIAGQGDLVLTELTARSAALTLPGGYDRVLVTQVRTDQIVAEVGTGASQRLALEPGVYGVKLWQGASLYGARVQLSAGTERHIEERELLVIDHATPKGRGADEGVSGSPRGERLSAVAAIGVTDGVANGLDAMAAARAGVSFPSGIALAVDAAGASQSTFSEYRVLGSAGYLVGIARGPWSAAAGAGVGVGAIAQRISGSDSAATALAGLLPQASATYQALPALGVEAELNLLVGAYRRDGSTAVSAWPAAYVGLRVTP